jgi:seryl-tRNA synthetase
MLDLKFIRQNPDLVRKAIHLKKIPLNLDDLLTADRNALEIRRELQALEEQKNANAKKVPKANPEERPALIQKGKDVSGKIETLKPRLLAAEDELQKYLWLVPQIPSPDAPVGATDEENVELRRWGTPRQFNFKPRDHVELMALNHWAELERVSKVAGTRSYALRNELVLLEMALHQFAMDRLRAKGFTLLSVPAMARESAFYGTGHFPTGREQVYHLPEDDLYLAGTAEVVTNALHAGEILRETDLPILYAAISPCFRREAGSSGKDTRGLIRVHQFMKVEQYVICKNDTAESERWHQEILRTSEEIVQALELPYRLMDVCTGDMGAGKFRQYDVEVWVPSEGKFRETHSCSNLQDWQARRTGIRYRNHEDTVNFCHTLNNTAIATPRILVPLLENHQQEEGSVRVPEALQPYLGGVRELSGSRGPTRS